jgi:DNA-binding NtrC family response regulator
VEVPSLQDRKEDIPLIANHFLRLYTELFQKPVDAIDAEAMKVLQQYAWPGNVRELENVVQRAVILTSDPIIKVHDLPVETQPEGVVNIEDYRGEDSFESRLREYKLKLAENAVREHDGNKTLAARSLKISRAYLHRLLRLADQDVPDTDRLNMETA